MYGVGMTTNIKDTLYASHNLSVEPDTSRGRSIVVFAVNDYGTESIATMVMEDFIKAVETELNGVFIFRDSYPEITESRGNIVIDGNSSWPVGLAHKNLEGIRSDALANLALAEYLEANPEVDQKQVDTLTDLIRTSTGTRSGSLADDGAAAVARELIASGKITVKTED